MEALRTHRCGHYPLRGAVGFLRSPYPTTFIQSWDNVHATGTTIVWTDAKRNLNFQSIDSNGNLLWTVPPLNTNAYELEARRDADGNTCLMWVTHAGQVYLQVIDNTGSPVWADAIELHGQSGYYHEVTLWLATDRPGGVVAAWRYGDDAPVEVRIVSTDGEVQVSAADQYFGQNDGATLPEPMCDAEDGLVMLWASNDSILAQRIDSEGTMLWGENGIVVGTNLATSDTGGPHIWGSNQPGGTVVSWEAETATGTVWRAQRIDSQGRLLWPSSGVIISTVTKDNWRWRWSATTSDGAAILSGVATEHIYRQSRVQKVNADGSLPWGPDGIRLDDLTPPSVLHTRADRVPVLDCSITHQTDL